MGGINLSKTLLHFQSLVKVGFICNNLYSHLLLTLHLVLSSHEKTTRRGVVYTPYLLYSSIAFTASGGASSVGT